MNPEFKNKSKLKEQPGRAVAHEGMTWHDPILSVPFAVDHTLTPVLGSR